MKLKEIVNQEFNMAIQAVMACPISAKASFNLGKVYRTAQEQQKHFNEAREAALKKFASLRDDGSIIADEQGIVEFKDDEAKQACVKELEELLDQDIEMPTISISALGDAKVEPRVLMALEKVIVE